MLEYLMDRLRIDVETIEDNYNDSQQIIINLNQQILHL